MNTLKQLLANFNYVYIYENSVGRQLHLGFDNEPLEFPTIGRGYECIGRLSGISPNERLDQFRANSEPPVGFTCPNSPCFNHGCMFHKNHPEYTWESPYGSENYFWHYDPRSRNDETFYNKQMLAHLSESCTDAKCIHHQAHSDYEFVSDYGEPSGWYLKKTIRAYEEGEAVPPVESTYDDVDESYYNKKVEFIKHMRSHCTDDACDTHNLSEFKFLNGAWVGDISTYVLPDKESN